MGEKKDRRTTKIDDWMARISFAEAGEPEQVLEGNDEDAAMRSRLALDKIMVVRAEKSAETNAGETDESMTSGVTNGTQETGGGKLRIMVLDDEPIVGKRLLPALEKHGFEVEVFVDSAEALARLEDQEFDIVVTDVRMEEVDGIQVLEYVMSACPNTRVILITGYATVEVAREALVKGAFDFIAKPFKPAELRAVINKAALSLGHKGVI